MACNLSSGRTISCTQAMGGIKRVYFGVWTDSFWRVAGYNGTDVNQIDSFGEALTVYRYDTRPNLSSMTITTTNGDATAGTPAYYQQACDLVLQKLDVQSLPFLKQLGDSRTIAFVVDMQNRTWVLGLKFGVRVTGGTAVSGASRADMSGFTISLSAEETDLMFCLKYDDTDTEQTASFPFAEITGTAPTISATMVTPA
tara:strand:+ start:406 stop:1002 length:597 start_codon:yes stop_codon:yes gene_type:complete